MHVHMYKLCCMSCSFLSPPSPPLPPPTPSLFCRGVEFSDFQTYHTHQLRGLIMMVGQINDTLDQTLSELRHNASVARLNLELQLNQGLGPVGMFEERLELLAQRLEVIEDNPQETLIQHVSDIHNEVSDSPDVCKWIRVGHV